jgi:hypothetical protein
MIRLLFFIITTHCLLNSGISGRIACAQTLPERQAQLALTPPMGWNSWNKFACNVSDALIRETAEGTWLSIREY